jgi:hypothetical protein
MMCGFLMTRDHHVRQAFIFSLIYILLASGLWFIHQGWTLEKHKTDRSKLVCIDRLQASGFMNGLISHACERAS